MSAPVTVLDPDETRRRALAAAKASEYVQAAELFTVLTQAAGDEDASPQAMEDRAQLMRALLKLGRYAEAGAVCDVIVRLDPTNEPALTRLSRIWERLGRMDLAADYAARAAALLPDSAEAQWTWALAAHNAGDRDEEADRALETTLRLQPDHPDATLARTEWSQQDQHSARPTTAAFASLQTFVRERQIAESGRLQVSPPPITGRALYSLIAGSVAFIALYLVVRILLIG